MARAKSDFTVGNPTKLMLKFAVPLILSMILQNLYNMADMVIVGRFVSEDALAAVGTSGSITMLVLMFISGATMGTSVVISQFYGAKDETRVKKTVSTSLVLIVGLSVVFSVLGAIFAPQLLQLINVPDNIMADSILYLRIIFLGSLATAMYNLASMISRALGDSVTPMIVLVICSVLNVGLNILFVTQFGMGVAGVAYATIIASAVSAVVCFIILWRKMPVIRPTGETMKVDKDIAKMVVKIGIPSALQSSSMALGNVLVQTAVNGFGSTVIAAYSAATKIEAFIGYGAGGITQAMQVFSGQNVGAGQFDRVRQGFKSALKVIIIYTLAAIAVLVLFGKPLVSIFTTESTQMIQVGYEYLLVAAAGQLFLGVLYLTRSTLIGAGDAITSVYISVLELVGRVIGAFVLARYFGYIGAFLGAPVGWVVGSIFGSVRYARGKWTQKALVKEKPAGTEPVKAAE